MSTYDKPYLSFPQQLQPLKARGARFHEDVAAGESQGT
jgi:hypothetical protein